MIEHRIHKLAEEPMVWINTAVLLFFASILFYNILFSQALNISLSFLRLIAFINLYLIAVFYLLIAFVFWKEGRKQSLGKSI